MTQVQLSVHEILTDITDRFVRAFQFNISFSHAAYGKR